MGQGVSIQMEGLDKLIKKFGKIPERITEEVDAIMAATANEFLNRAVADVPIDQGIMHNLLSMSKIGIMDYVIVSGASWSAYVEFGTRGRVQVPSDLAEYASQFKGGSNSNADVKKFIFDWCKRKGIDKKMWFPIFISIMVKGIHPHPFFFPQLPIAQANLNRDLKDAVNKALAS